MGTQCLRPNPRSSSYRRLSRQESERRGRGPMSAMALVCLLAYQAR